MCERVCVSEQRQRREKVRETQKETDFFFPEQYLIDIFSFRQTDQRAEAVLLLPPMCLLQARGALLSRQKSSDKTF